MNAMKVLYFTNIPVPYRMDFFNELAKQCELTVMMECDTNRSLDANWMKNHKVSGYRYILLPYFGSRSNTRINWGYRKDILEEKYDIVVVGTYYSLSARIFIDFLRIHKIPYILNSDGGFIKQDKFIVKKIKKHYISSANAYISTGKGTTEYLAHYGANSMKVYTIPFSSLKKEDIICKPCSAEQRLAIRTRLGITEENVIIFVGQFIYRKGIDVLLKALKYCDNNIGVYIVGGEATEEYESLAAISENHNIHFVEFLTKKVLLDYYRAADFFVFPTREDIWGLVLNEALAQALPCVTTDKCLAGLELIKNGYNGYIVPKDDKIKLAEAINKMFENTDALNDMRNNALESIRRYTIEEMVDAHINIFKRCLEKR